MISVNNSKLAPKKAPLANENIFIIAKLLFSLVLMLK